MQISVRLYYIAPINNLCVIFFWYIYALIAQRVFIWRKDYFIRICVLSPHPPPVKGGPPSPQRLLRYRGKVGAGVINRRDDGPPSPQGWRSIIFNITVDNYLLTLYYQIKPYKISELSTVMSISLMNYCVLAGSGAYFIVFLSFSC